MADINFAINTLLVAYHDWRVFGSDEHWQLYKARRADLDLIIARGVWTDSDEKLANTLTAALEFQP